METSEKIMSGEESLKIITGMINKTKGNIRQSSFHLLFWGWLIFACSLAEYLLGKFTSYATPWHVWYLVIPGVFVSLIYGAIKGRKAKVHTYAEMLSMWTWLGFIIAATILFILLKNNMESVPPFILLLAGFPTFVSGFILRFKPLIFGGLSMWAFSVVANFGGPDIAPLAVPVAMLTGYLIPGYILRRKVDHDSV
ncbi:MAG: hypothetical protein Q8868_12350 [Bacteroidota bacterium]|nr:hypothetical protein [Bacteroidota bacterium]